MPDNGVLPKNLDDALYRDLDEAERAKLYTGTPGLVGTWELARLLGKERSRIARWLDENKRGKKKIPPPDAYLKCGPVWLISTIEEWLASEDVPKEAVVVLS